MLPISYHVCHRCGSPANERVFTDSYTGQDYCLSCLYETEAVGKITMSPSEDGDNINEILKEI